MQSRPIEPPEVIDLMSLTSIAGAPHGHKSINRWLPSQTNGSI